MTIDYTNSYCSDTKIWR